MNGDDRRDGATPPGGPASGSPSEREHAIQEVAARVAAAAAQRAQAAARREASPSVPAGPTQRCPPVFPAVATPDDPRAAPASSVVRHEVVPPPPASRPPVVSAPAHLKSTEPMQDLAYLARASAPELLPATPAPPRRVAPPTMQSRVRGLGETTPVGDDSIEKARAAAAPVRVPPLDDRQYASLCAELAFAPESRGVILVRYQVYSEAELVALDAHWRRECAANPEVRARMANDITTHTAWLHRHVRRG